MSILHYLRPAMKQRFIAGVFPDWLRRHVRQSYIVAAVLSYPPWIERKEFAALLIERDRLTRETGVAHVFDHDIPLLHPKVCGLTVPWNIKIITARANGRKGNSFSPTDCEQMELCFANHHGRDLSAS